MRTRSGAARAFAAAALAIGTAAQEETPVQFDDGLTFAPEPEPEPLPAPAGGDDGWGCKGCWHLTVADTLYFLAAFFACIVGSLFCMYHCCCGADPDQPARCLL